MCLRGSIMTFLEPSIDTISKVCMTCPGSGLGQVQGSCEQGNEPSGSIKCFIPI
jgi:hypothetical protein